MAGHECASSEFEQHLEELGARWFVYGQLDRQIHVGSSSMLGDEYYSLITDIQSMGKGHPVVLSLRRGASVPYPRTGATLTESPFGQDGDMRFEYYFRPDPDWVPAPTDLIFDVLWERPETGYKLLKVLNVIRIGWAQPRWGREDRIAYWNLMGRDIDFDDKRLAKVLKKRLPTEQLSRPRGYRRKWS